MSDAQEQSEDARVRAQLVAVTTRFAELLDADLDGDVELLPGVLERRLADLTPLADDLREASEQLTIARAARRTLFALSARLMSQLAWCAGYLSSEEQTLPDAVTSVLDEAVHELSGIDDSRESSSHGG